jgi:site-specific recombinase XerD
LYFSMSQNGTISSMYLSEIIQDFLEYVEIERGRSAKTAENYHLYLMRLIDFAGDIKVEQISEETIRKWRLWLNRYKNEQGEPLSTLTQSYHLIAMRGFLTYCVKRGIPALTPEKIELPKVRRKQVTFLQPKEVERLFEVIDIDRESGLRDRAILELLYSSGLRVSELVNLDRTHINIKRREFMVRGKGQKDRPVFISDEAAYWLQAYLNRRTDNIPALFISYSGRHDLENTGDFRRLTPRSVQRIISGYAKLAGITKKVSPHTMRHSYATDLLVNGADLRSVQAMLGHSNIATTQIYTHVTDPHLRDVHQRFHRKNS